MRRSFSLANVSSKYPIWLSTSLWLALMLLPLMVLSDGFHKLPALSLLTLECVLRLCGLDCALKGGAARDAAEMCDDDERAGVARRSADATRLDCVDDKLPRNAA